MKTADHRAIEVEPAAHADDEEPELEGTRGRVTAHEVEVERRAEDSLHEAQRKG